MGNTASEASEIARDTSDDLWWNPIPPPIRVDPLLEEATMSASTQTDPQLPTMEENQQNLAEFQLELERKHEKRRELIMEKRKEILQMKDDLARYKQENQIFKAQQNPLLEQIEQLKKENYELKLRRESNESITSLKKQLDSYKAELQQHHNTNKALKEENEEIQLQVEKLKLELKSGEEIQSKNKELRIALAEMQVELQKLNSELVTIEQERLEYAKHISALKDVIRVTKDMLAIRENQIEDLKVKIKNIEELLASKEIKIMSDGLREEYERQLRNIRNLRTLYDDRQRLDKRDKEHLQAQLDETKILVEDEQKKNKELQDKINELENDIVTKTDTINSLNSNLGLSKAECKELQAEIGIINQLFSQVLLGFNSTQEVDLDKLLKNLEENHELLTNMATSEGSTSAALPKLLLDLINQMNKKGDGEEVEETLEIVSHDLGQLNSAEEIVETLPKVWKVMIELLSHQNPPSNVLCGSSADPCYKSVETPAGPKLKLSVSQTFIRLKDLILEKKFLERETYRLKHLNTHLETRLQDQEQRLVLVSGELKSTWQVVDKMQKQHQQLHTHEQVLRYELREKRKLLNELKVELQHCREKWTSARAKNDTTQAQWKELRKEFSDRKKRPSDDFNQSGESGYSDAKDSSEDERGYESDVEDSKCTEEDSTAEIGEGSIEKTEIAEVAKESETPRLHIQISPVLVLPEVTVQNASGENLQAPENVSPLTASPTPELDPSLRFMFPRRNEEDSLLAHVDVPDEINEYLEIDAILNALTPAELENADVEELAGELSEIFPVLPPIPTEPELPLETPTTPSIASAPLSSAESAPSSPTELPSETPKTPSIDSAPLSIPDLASASTIPSTSTESTPSSPTKRTAEEILSTREARLKRLEEECKQLVSRVTNTSQKSVDISNKLDSLHETYGEPRTAQNGEGPSHSNESNDDKETK